MNGVLQTLITIVLFLAILGVLVVIHELGHFVTARLAERPRPRVRHRLPAARQGASAPKGETLYTLNWLPIGGFVKLEGEDGDQADDPRSFVGAGPADPPRHPRRRRGHERRCSRSPSSPA